MAHTNDQIKTLRALHADPQFTHLAWFMTEGGTPLAVGANANLSHEDDRYLMTWGDDSLLVPKDAQAELRLQAARLRKKAVEDMKGREWQIVHPDVPKWFSPILEGGVYFQGSDFWLCDLNEVPISAHKSRDEAQIAAEPDWQEAARLMEKVFSSLDPQTESQ